MQEWIENNITKLLGSAGVFGIFHFFSQLAEYMADGKLDNMEIQQLLSSASSVAETSIVIAVAVYFKFFKSGKE